MTEEAKKYLSLYLLQHAKIQRLTELSRLNPERDGEYKAEIAECEALRRTIEEKIDRTDKGVLGEILYFKYLLGKTLPEIAYLINYSQRQTERLHRQALEKFSALQEQENGV